MTINDIGGGGGGVDHNESLLKLTDAPQALKIFSQITQAQTIAHTKNFKQKCINILYLEIIT